MHQPVKAISVAWGTRRNRDAARVLEADRPRTCAQDSIGLRVASVERTDFSDSLESLKTVGEKVDNFLYPVRICCDQISDSKRLLW